MLKKCRVRPLAAILLLIGVTLPPAAFSAKQIQCDSPDIALRFYPTASAASTRSEKAKMQQVMQELNCKEYTAIYNQRDIIWHSAQRVLANLISGKITSKNIYQYVIPTEAEKFKNNTQAMSVIISTIHSLGNTIRTDNITNHKARGVFARMMTKRSLNHSFHSSVLFRVKKDGNIYDIIITLNNKTPLKSQKWQLSGLFLKTSAPLR